MARRRRLVTAWGETKTLLEWVDDQRCRVAFSTLQKRLRTMSPEDAISRPSSLRSVPNRRGCSCDSMLADPHVRSRIRACLRACAGVATERLREGILREHLV